MQLPGTWCSQHDALYWAANTTAYSTTSKEIDDRCSAPGSSLTHRFIFCAALRGSDSVLPLAKRQSDISPRASKNILQTYAAP
jgi:hypothetical protein